MQKFLSAFICLCLLAPGCVIASGKVPSTEDPTCLTPPHGLYLVGCNPDGTKVVGWATALINFVCLSPLGLAIGMPIWIGSYATYNSFGASENDSYTGEVDSQ